MAGLKINVTREHIAKGVPLNCEECAVALAMKDAGLKGVKAGYMRLFIGDGLVYTPNEVFDFMVAFDKGYTWALKPFSFELCEDGS